MVEYVKKLLFHSERMKKYRYPALILALGLLMLLIPFGKTGSSPEQKETAEIQDSEFDLTAFTQETEALLSELKGTGKVKVLFSLENDGERDYLVDRSESSSDSADQLASTAVLVTRNGDQNPVTVLRTYPRFRGAVVVCQEASPTLTLQIKEALSSLTGLKMDKITVLSSR